MASEKLFDKNFIDELKDRTDIVGLIGRYVTLKKAGTGKYNCCCPFHNEKTPSFVVDEKENSFKCYGGSCGESGDPIDFLVKHQNLNFVEAVHELCSINGVQVPKSDKDSAELAKHRKAYFNFTNRLRFHMIDEGARDEGAIFLSKIPVNESFKESLQLGVIANPKRLQAILNGKSLESDKGTYEKIGVLNQEGTLTMSTKGIYIPVTSRRGAVLGFTFVDSNLQHHTTPESDLFRPEDELINIANVDTKAPCYFSFDFKNAVQAHKALKTDNVLIAPLGDYLAREQQLIKAKRVADDLTFLVPGEPGPRHAVIASLLVNYELGDSIKVLDLKSGKRNYLLDFVAERWSSFPESSKEFYKEATEGTACEFFMNELDPPGHQLQTRPTP